MPGIGEFGVGFQSALYGLRKQLSQYAVRYTRGPVEPIITVPPTAASVEYGVALPALEGGTVINTVGATVEGSFAWQDPHATPDVGTQDITVVFIPDDTDTYNTAEVDVEIVITVRPIEVTAHDQSKTYGYDNPDLTYSISSGSLVGSDTFSGSLTTTVDTNTNAGTYNNSITQGTLTLGANYDITFINGNFIINKATPIVSVLPTAGSISSGNAYTTSSLTGGSATHLGNAVDGTFGWVAGQTPYNHTIDSGSQTFNSSGWFNRKYKNRSYNARFNPTNTTNYNSSAAFSRTIRAWQTTASVIVIAGGGGGGRKPSLTTSGMSCCGAGGGGGGGARSSTVSITGNVYVTVGAGGAGAPSSAGSKGSNGGSSSFGSLLSAVGGGGGGSEDNRNGNSGGSGGGAGSYAFMSLGNGGSGTVGQGNKGGDTFVSGDTFYPAGGGGGAGGPGSSVQCGDTALGGSGVTYSGVTYSKGGFGRTGSSTSSGSSANNNTGGGGSAGRWTGGNGGSGRVIVSY